MDREKLEKAAKNVAAWETINSSERMSNFYCSLGFTKGAEWLQSQPIADRLTEGEREKIKEMYAELIPLKGHMAGIVGQMMLLEQIFGKEMFEK